MSYPKKIKNVRDGNELEFVRFHNMNKEIIHVYKYTKSETKQGMELPLKEADLEYYLKENIFINNQ